MSTLSGLLDLSRSALNADQAALNLTATNVANQNTPGYTDQVATFSSGDTVWLSSGSTQSTTGPQVTAISQRDRVLNQRVQQQTQAQSATSSEASVLSQVENVFSISGSSATAGSTQLGTAIDGLFSSLTALGANPSDASTRQGVLGAAQSVASAFNAAAGGISGVQESINGGISSSVTQVNALTTTIAKLNVQIASLAPNSDAGALEDQRQQAITQLSGLVGLDQVTTERNGIQLSTTNGSVLVSGSQAYALQSSVVGGTTQVYNSSGAAIGSALTGGSIGGQLAGQNTDLPAAQSALDALAFRIGNAVNTQNAAGMTPSGATGGTIFNVTTTAAGAAAALSVAATNASVLASAGTGEGSTGNTNANALAALAQVTDSSGETMNGNLAALLSQVGSTSASLQQQSTAQQASLTQLTTQQSTLSGVNLDTEAANLTQYQRSYQAAAQVLTIVDKLMAAAINIGVETAVS